MFRKNRLICILSCIFFTCLAQDAQAQRITGEIFGKSKEKVSSATITFKDLRDTALVMEYILAKNGVFVKKLERSYSDLLIEISSIGYQSDSYVIRNLQKGRDYSVEFNLIPLEVNYLDEVVVSANKKPYQVKKDTIVFTASEYVSAEDRKVEDLLKKIPGIEVNENSGEIKYRGKSIEALLLEGDDLFKKNYSIGSRNINVDLVAEVEAIENYTENPLLRGVSSYEKVALNLKLKSGKINFSGSLDIGGGVFENDSLATSVNTNILAINKKSKSFSVLSFNDIGLNVSPINFSSDELNIDQTEEYKRIANKKITQIGASDVLDFGRANINQQLFLNHNNIFELGPSTSLTANVFYIDDKIFSSQFVRNEFRIYGENFITKDEFILQKEPQYYRIDLDLEHRISRNTLLEYTSRIRYENVHTSSQTIQNENIDFSTELSDKDLYIKNDFLITHRFTDKTVLQFSSRYSENSLPQSFEIIPSPITMDSEAEQFSEFNKKYLGLQTTLLGITGKSKYSIQLGYNDEEIPYFSSLNTTQIGQDNETVNQVLFSRNKLFAELRYAFVLGDFSVRPTITYSNLQQRLNDVLDVEKNTSDSYLESNILITYKPSNISRLFANLVYSKASNADQFLFRNEVLINNRTLLQNDPSLSLQNNCLLSLNYSLNDLFNQLELGAGLFYQSNNGNFFANSEISENFSRIQYFFAMQKNNSLGANTFISKYIPLIQSTIKGTVDYNYTSYQNIVNNSGFRENRNHFIRTSLFIKTSFDIPINFENSFSYSQLRTVGDNQDEFFNSRIINRSKIFLDFSERFFTTISADYFLPETRQTELNFIFLDAAAEYSLSKNDVKIGLQLRNILNEKNFLSIQTTDISTTTFGSNLLPMHVLLSFSLNF